MCAKSLATLGFSAMQSFILVYNIPRLTKEVKKERLKQINKANTSIKWPGCSHFLFFASENTSENFLTLPPLFTSKGFLIFTSV